MTSVSILRSIRRECSSSSTHVLVLTIWRDSPPTSPGLVFLLTSSSQEEEELPADWPDACHSLSYTGGWAYVWECCRSVLTPAPASFPGTKWARQDLSRRHRTSPAPRTPYGDGRTCPGALGGAVLKCGWVWREGPPVWLGLVAPASGFLGDRTLGPCPANGND